MGDPHGANAAEHSLGRGCPYGSLGTFSVVTMLLKWMARIHEMNGFTIPQEVYGSLLLSLSTGLLTQLKQFLLKPWNERDRFVLRRMWTKLPAM